MKIILTGAAGFIGSCFLWKLNRMGIDQILAVDTPRHGSPHPNLSGKKIKDYLDHQPFLAGIKHGRFTEFDGIIHLGACTDTTEKDRQFLDQNNTVYSRTLAEWALAHGKKFHYASSASVYGNGLNGFSDRDEDIGNYMALNPYADSKIKFDQWLIENKLTSKVVGYRYFNVFGPNEYHKGDMKSMVCKAYDQIKSTGKVKLFSTTRPGHHDGSEERDFVYVKDVCDVMAYFLEHPDKSGIFNIGTGKARSFKDLVLAVFASMQIPVDIEFIPMPESLRSQYQYFTEADISRLRQADYKEPFPRLEVSVAGYVKYHLSQKNPQL